MIFLIPWQDIPETLLGDIETAKETLNMALLDDANEDEIETMLSSFVSKMLRICMVEFAKKGKK